MQSSSIWDGAHTQWQVSLWDRRGETQGEDSHVKTKAEIAGIWLQAKEHQGLLTIVQSEESIWDKFYPRASGRSVVPLTLFLKVYLFCYYFWLCGVFVAVQAFP